MMSKIILSAVAAAVIGLSTPSQASAYGAAHVGYTHVGPNGVQHYSETAVSRPGGTYGTSSYGSAYHYGGASYGASYHAGYGYSSTAGYHAGYSYSPSYSSAHYAYVR